MEKCQVPADLSDGKFATVYRSNIADAKLWEACVRKDRELMEIVQYRDAFCQRLADKQAADKAKAGQSLMDRIKGWF